MTSASVLIRAISLSRSSAGMAMNGSANRIPEVLAAVSVKSKPSYLCRKIPCLSFGAQNGAPFGKVPRNDIRVHDQVPGVRSGHGPGSIGASRLDAAFIPLAISALQHIL